MMKSIFLLLTATLLLGCPPKEAQEKESSQREETIKDTNSEPELEVEKETEKIMETASEDTETVQLQENEAALSLSLHEKSLNITSQAPTLSFWNPEEVLPLRMEYPDYGWEDPPLFISTGGEPRIEITHGHTSQIFIVDWEIPAGGCTLELTDPENNVYTLSLTEEDLIPLQVSEDWDSGITFEPPLIPLVLKPSALYPPGQWKVKVLSEERAPVEKLTHLGLNFSIHKKQDPSPFEEESGVRLSSGESATFFYRSNSEEIFMGLYRYTEEYEEEPVYTEIYEPLAVFSTTPISENLYENLYTITIQATEELPAGTYMIGLITNPEENPKPLAGFTVN